MITQELQLDKQHQYYKSRKRSRVERNKKYKGRDTARSGKLPSTRVLKLQDNFRHDLKTLEGKLAQRDKDFLDDLYI